MGYEPIEKMRSDGSRWPHFLTITWREDEEYENKPSGDRFEKETRRNSPHVGERCYKTRRMGGGTLDEMNTNSRFAPPTVAGSGWMPYGHIDLDKQNKSTCFVTAITFNIPVKFFIYKIISVRTFFV